MEIYIIITIIVLCIAAFVLYYIYFKKQQVSNVLIDLILNHKYKEFDEIIETYQVCSAVNDFTRYMLKLRKGILVGNKSEIKEAYDNALLFAKNDKKKEELFTTMLEYFIKIDSKNKVEEMYQELKKLPKLKNKATIENAYNNYIK